MWPSEAKLSGFRSSQSRQTHPQGAQQIHLPTQPQAAQQGQPLQTQPRAHQLPTQPRTEEIEYVLQRLAEIEGGDMGLSSIWWAMWKLSQRVGTVERAITSKPDAKFRASSSGSSSSSKDPLSDKFYLKRKQLTVKNKAVRQWSLFAKRDLEPGEFLGLYSGTFRKTTNNSLYALEIDDDIGIAVFPFENEENITYEEREMRPFANMNEPEDKTAANCIMFVLDFSADEIENVQTIPNYEKAYFFRGIVCLICAKVNMHQELTWHYGPGYEPHRTSQGYIAGFPCKFKLKEEHFANFTPIPASDVFPVFKRIKSDRFGKYDSSSEEEYIPPSESREVRQQRRTRQKQA